MIDSNTVIDSNTKIAPDVKKMGPFTVFGPNVKIGSETRKGNTKIGIYKTTVNGELACSAEVLLAISQRRSNIK